MTLCFISKLKLCETRTILLVLLIMRFLSLILINRMYGEKAFLGSTSRS